MAYFVGGCVRNAVMNVPVSDIDIATDATPDQIAAICTKAGFKSVPTGVEHGTMTVVISDHPFEVTTFRKDIATDGRRAVVAFSTDIAEDARRRDFTMNALYADRHGTVRDPVGGMDDARARRVRFIDDPSQRIQEDYLRTLRFFRFNAQYGTADVAWDPDALAGVAANLDGLSTLSAERVGAEMMKLLAAPDPAPALAVMQQTGVLAIVLPGADPRLVGPFVHLESGCGARIDPVARLATLGGDGVVDRLRLSKRDRRRLDSINRLSISSDTPKAIGFLGGPDAGRGALLLRSAYANAPLDANDMRLVEQGAQTQFPVLAKDLPHLAGPELGKELARLERLWLRSDLSLLKHELLMA